jgi:hypothetical protein
MSLPLISRISFAIATVDLILAVMCAILGQVHFVAFMVLAGLMYAHGAYYKHKAEDTGE